MYSKSVIVRTREGRQSFAMAELLTCASRYKSKITIKKLNGDEGNAKSMIMMLSMGLSRGEKVEVHGRGPDEVQAVEAIVEMLEKGGLE